MQNLSLSSQTQFQAPSLGDETTVLESTFDALLASNPQAARLAGETLLRELNARRIHFGGTRLPSSLKPHFLARSVTDPWIRDLTRFVELLESAARHFIIDPQLRSGPLFSPEAWALFDIDPGYQRFAVSCRPDVTWFGSRTALLEMNADSPAMMVYADHVQDLQRELFPLRDLEGAITFDHRTRNLLGALLDTYHEWGGTRLSPTIAIIDWRGQKTAEEQEQLAADFTRFGYPSFVCHPDELEVRGGRLLGRGEPIDIVQRRLLLPEIVSRMGELRPFLNAYRERLVCVVNPLRSYLLGCKGLLATLCRNGWFAALPPSDKELIGRILPTTRSLAAGNAGQFERREQWVLKPAFGSGGQGIVIGRFSDDATWASAVATATEQGNWVAQEYVPVPTYSVPLFAGDELTMKRLYANWNPFFFGGRFGGAITRVSGDPIVGISAGGALLPAVTASGE